MAEFFIFICLVLLALLGLSEAIHMLFCRILKPKSQAERVLLLYLTEDGAEQQLMYALEQKRWNGCTYADKIVAVTGKLSAEVKHTCISRFKSDYISFAENF